MRPMTVRVAMLLCISLVLALAARDAEAGPFRPSGLNSGETYQLIFVTQDTTAATSPDIADYHDFVQAEAELNAALTGTDVGVTYSAVASAVNDATGGARDNAVVSGPVYNLAGDKIADGFADLWDGTIDAPVGYTQFAQPLDTWVWTGSTKLGTPYYPLGTFAHVYRSRSTAMDSSWIWSGPEQYDLQLSLYALSSPITVPQLDADFDGDGIVAAADYTVWRDNLGAAGLEPYELGDGDGDGSVTAADYDAWRTQFGQTIAASAVADIAVVPEPKAIIVLLGLASGLCLRGRR